MEDILLKRAEAVGNCEAVFILGPPRTGKSRVAAAIADSLDIVNLDESGILERALSRTDEISLNEVSPAEIENVRAMFRRSAGEAPFLEATPGNCLRIPLLEAIFPSARFVIMMRDENAILRDMRLKRRAQGSLRARMRRALAALRSGKVPPGAVQRLLAGERSPRFFATIPGCAFARTVDEYDRCVIQKMYQACFRDLELGNMTRIINYRDFDEDPSTVVQSLRGWILNAPS